jgi:hypothetical protein
LFPEFFAKQELHDSIFPKIFHVKCITTNEQQNYIFLDKRGEDVKKILDGWKNGTFSCEAK